MGKKSLNYSGFHTKWVYFSKMQDMFKQVGFKCDFTPKTCLEMLSIGSLTLLGEFHLLADEDLLVGGIDLVVRCKAED
jgi:hypothetical protein